MIRYMQMMLFLMLLAGCAMNGDVVNVGPDTYSVDSHAAPVRGGSMEARRMAIDQAQQYCAKLGKEAQVLNIGLSPRAAEVQFRCVPNAP